MNAPSPFDKIPLEFDEREHNLLLKAEPLASQVPDEVRNAIRLGDCYYCLLTVAELVHLGDAIRESLPKVSELEDRKCLYGLWIRIGDTLEASFLSEEEGFSSSRLPFAFPPELEKDIWALLQDGGFSSVEEAKAAIGRFVDDYNHTPQEELGGLSPGRLGTLVWSDWNSPDSAVKFSPELTLEQVKEARIFSNARWFLSRLKEEGGAKVTGKGYLNRKFVKTASAGMVFGDNYSDVLEWIEDMTINEYDLSPLHQLRVVLKLGGLIRKIKGMFHITRRGEAMLADEKAGELFVHLFKTFFVKLDLASLDGYPEMPEIQDTVAFSFYRLSRLAGDWNEGEELAGHLFLPVVRQWIPGARGIEGLCYTRLYRPLDEFGLLALRDLPIEKPWDRHYEVRKTPLFDRLLKFEV